MEVGVGRGVTKCESHVHVCCFSEIRKEVEACESVFCCVFSVLWRMSRWWFNSCRFCLHSASILFFLQALSKRWVV